MFRRLAVLGTALSAVVALGPSASAADGWDVPHSARITIDGHGYGHGKGMSQYGAQHAAKLGQGYRQIVGYYYPHTRWTTAAGSIRVWISRDLTNDVQVAARPGLTARRTGTAQTWDLARARPRADRWRIVPDGDAASILQYRSHGWHQFRRVSGLLELSAHGRPVRLYTADGSTSYRGVLKSVPSSPGNRITVDVLPLETYLRGVVPAETYASVWHQQALRAQAVAARTYAVHERADRRDAVFDLCETEACQAYGGATAEYPTSDTAVKATAHQVLTYDGAPAFTQFTASSGGWTVDGGAPYLPARRDRWDSPKDPYHAWTVPFRDTEIEAAWPAVGDLARIELGQRDGHGEWGGRVGTVTLTGSAGTVTLTGSDFAQRLQLASSWFTMRVS
ncbi:MAG: SpoIID/LytB domain-containing protein [Nocardioides sp.]|nr:SpoIID/LytB domain-containing protein [Nocardioidaceae bacterium]MCB8956428.1 SpoIID/LytB domain-containing protein [Nocardioides sp.]